MRADLWLVQAGLAPTRTAAQRLIQAGSVLFVGEPARQVTKAGELVASHATLELLDSSEITFVSRAGLKLAFALEQFSIDPSGLVCLDVGQSTGGFTDCLLRGQAKQVVGIDVGHDQVHQQIRSDSRVTVLEKLNIRDEQSVLALKQYAPFDLAVVDVSFISLSKVLPNVMSLLKPSTTVVALYKPQFEVGPAFVGKRGIVKDLQQVERQIQLSLNEYEAFAVVKQYPIKAPITGADGNQEYLLALQPK